MGSCSCNLICHLKWKQIQFYLSLYPKDDFFNLVYEETLYYIFIQYPLWKTVELQSLKAIFICFGYLYIEI